MSQQFWPASPQSDPRGSRLASGYDELTRLDQALHQAEARLTATHQSCAGQADTEQARELYLQVLALRERARQVMTELAEMWVSER